MGLMTAYHAAPQALGEALRVRRVRVLENSVLRGITRSGLTWCVDTDAGPVESEVLVITAGLGTNEVLKLVPGCGPGADEAFAGVGWRGTGYKFAPWVGRVLARLALQRGTGYDIRRFAPARFASGYGVGELKAGGAVS